MSFDPTINLNLVIAVLTAVVGLIGFVRAWRINKKKKILQIHEVLDEAWELIVGPNADLSKAERLIELKANPIIPNFYRTIYIWGVLHYEMEKFDIAEKAWLKCLKNCRKVGSQPDAMYENLSRLYIRTKKYEKAKAVLEKLVQRGKKLAFAYYHYGLLSLENSKTLEAKNNFLKTIHHNPKHASGYVNLVAICTALGQLDDAESFLDKAIKEEAVVKQTYKNGVGLFLKSGNEKRANEMLHLLKSMDDSYKSIDRFIYRGNDKNYENH